MSTSMTYSAAGELLTMTNTQSGTVVSQSFGTSGISTANNQITQGYTYDALGNVTNNVHSYTYDAENNLISVDNGSTANYVYDALNERVQTNVGGVVQNYGFDSQGRRSTVWPNGSTSVNQVQYYAAGLGKAFWSNTDNNIHFEHMDGVGNERVRTTSTATVEGTYASLPFGEPNSSTGTDINPGHYAELDQDGTSGLQLSHAMFREYDSVSGKWINTDPYFGSYNFNNPQSFNRYAYALNNPLGAVDPSGLDSCGTEEDPGFAQCEAAMIVGEMEQYIPIPVSADTTVDVYADADDSIGIDPDTYLYELANQSAANATVQNFSIGYVPFMGVPGAINVPARIAEAKKLLSDNCSTVLGKDFTNYSTPALFDSLSNATVYQDPTVFNQKYATTTGNSITLFGLFYGESPSSQAFTLIHEGLHVYTQLDDPNLQAALHLPVTPNNTHNITTFLQGGCSVQ